MDLPWSSLELALISLRHDHLQHPNATFTQRFGTLIGPLTAPAEWTAALHLTHPDEARAWLHHPDRGATPLVAPARIADAPRWWRLRVISPAADAALLDVEDVTAEREAFERIRLEGQHFHALIERSAEGISLFDTGANILYESPSNKRIHGYEQWEMEGKNLFDFCHEDDLARAMPRFTHLAQAPGIVETEIVRFKHKAGHWIYIEGTVINATDDPRVRALVNNFREVTGRLEAERELRRAKDAAEEAQRLQQHFLTNLSHEFKTPLTLIRGPLLDLAEGRIDAAQSPAVLSRVLRNVDRLNGLISELIDLAKLDAGTFGLKVNRHDLVEFLAAEIDTFRELAAARRITVHLTAPGRCPVFFDATKLAKVVTNLLGNALRYSPEGGTVAITLTVHDTPETENAGQVSVAVRDDGPGMDEPTRARVFERFFQADTSLARSHEGMGIGLALAREMVEMHGGTVAVASEFGHGSTFSFTLALGCEHFDPDDIDTAAVPEPRPHTVGSAISSPELARPALDTTHRPRLLLVEDNQDMRAYLRMNLDPYYRVSEAVDGRDAVSRLAEHNPEIIISDVMMPHLDGLELCRHLKQDARWRQVPIILLSAKGSVDHRVEGLQAGADDYLAKPFSVAELLQRLRTRVPWTVLTDTASQKWRQLLEQTIDLHIASADFDVAGLARKLNYSERQLRRRTIDHFGLTPSALILQHRLARARELQASHTHETLAEIAHAVGMSPGYLSRRYRRAYGP